MKPLKRDRPKTHKHMVKSRHSEAYNQAMSLLIKQMQHYKHNSACICGSNMVKGVGGKGTIDLFCAECNKHLFTKSMKREKYGNKMDETQKKRLRDGLCENCGYDTFYGRLYIPSKNKWVFHYYCVSCKSNYVLLEKDVKNTQTKFNKDEKTSEQS